MAAFRVLLQIFAPMVKQSSVCRLPKARSGPARSMRRWILNVRNARYAASCLCAAVLTERGQLGSNWEQVRSIVRKDGNWTVDPLRVADPRRHRAAILLV